MVRVLLLGAAALGVAVLIDRQFGSVFGDIKRYNRIRAMSNEPSVYREGFGALAGMLGTMARAQKGEDAALAPHGAPKDGSVIDVLREDFRRYATIRAM